jgi:hypothetical protein
MLPIRPTDQFRKDLKRAKRQGRDLDKVRLVLEKLSSPEPLPPKFREHKLKGQGAIFVNAIWNPIGCLFTPLPISSCAPPGSAHIRSYSNEQTSIICLSPIFPMT